jgi:hypothetical protein
MRNVRQIASLQTYTHHLIVILLRPRTGIISGINQLQSLVQVILPKLEPARLIQQHVLLDQEIEPSRTFCVELLGVLKSVQNYGSFVVAFIVRL